VCANDVRVAAVTVQRLAISDTVFTVHLSEVMCVVLIVSLALNWSDIQDYFKKIFCNVTEDARLLCVIS